MTAGPQGGHRHWWAARGCREEQGARAGGGVLASFFLGGLPDLWKHPLAPRLSKPLLPANLPSLALGVRSQP
jgi:hypothetical protein